MRPNDLDSFFEMLDAIWGLKGAPAPSGIQKAMFFRALAAHPIEEVRSGLDAHLRDPKRGHFLPMPADVIAQINGMVAEDGRPGVEEAWALAFRATDEAATVVWTDEIAEAYGMALPLIKAGDEVAARMAFKEVYLRLVSVAREQRVAPAWSATLGGDSTARDAVLLPHVQAGRLSEDLLLGGPPVRMETLLSLPPPKGATEASVAVRDKAMGELRRLRDQLAERKNMPSLAVMDAQRTQQLKAESAALVHAVRSSANHDRVNTAA